MRKHLNTLYITTQGAYLSKDGETVAVNIENEVKMRLPIHTLGSIVCFGQVMCSPPLMGFCAEHNVAISFLSEYGRFWAKVEGPVSGNVLLRRAQYRCADSGAERLKISRAIVTAKLLNSRSVVQRAIRDHGGKIDAGGLVRVSSRLSQSVEKVERTVSLDELRGIEGESARDYFGVFDDLITSQKDGFVFNKRSRRPPMDAVNCLLSFIYTLLMHDVRSALETVGLDTEAGFFHRDRSGRPGLALDLMEEFRPYFADRLVLTLINLNQVKKEGFKKGESGAVLMDDDTRKTVLVAYQKRKEEELVHPFLQEDTTVGILFYVQSLLLARYLRGDIDGYPAFIWK